MILLNEKRQYVSDRLPETNFQMQYIRPVETSGLKEKSTHSNNEKCHSLEYVKLSTQLEEFCSPELQLAFLLLLLFRLCAKSLDAQEERLATSP